MKETQLDKEPPLPSLFRGFLSTHMQKYYTSNKQILDLLHQNDYKIKPGCCCFISTFPFLLLGLLTYRVPESRHFFQILFALSNLLSLLPINKSKIFVSVTFLFSSVVFIFCRFTHCLMSQYKQQSWAELENDQSWLLILVQYTTRSCSCPPITRQLMQIAWHLISDENTLVSTSYKMPI